MPVSASSDAPLAAAAAMLPTPKEVRSWGTEGVKQWAMKVDGTTEVHANILVAQEIDGAALLDVVTKDDLLKVGVPLGPAGKLMNAVAAIKKAGGTAPTDGGAGGAGGGGASACGWGGGGD